MPLDESNDYQRIADDWLANWMPAEVTDLYLIQCAVCNPAGLITGCRRSIAPDHAGDQTRQFILERHNGGLAQLDLISREAQTAEQILLSIAGTIRTALYQEMVRSDSDGDTSGYVLVPEEPIIRKSPRASRRWTGCFPASGAASPACSRHQQRAEEKSFNTCEACGQPGRLVRSDAYWCTVCPAHEDPRSFGVG